MTVVIGMTDLLLMGADQAEQRELLHSVKHAADALLRMLDEAVDFSRLEVGGLPLDERVFSLAEVVEAARQSLAAGPSVLSLSPVIDQDIPARLLGDGDRLRQMIEGLSRSAAKFRPGREYDLQITAEPAPQGEPASTDIVLRVSLGEHNRPFDFADDNAGAVRLADFDTRGYTGSGLSIPVAAGLAELMGGRLWICKDNRSSLVFSFTARCALPHDNLRNHLLAMTEERPAGPAADPSSLNVLLAEDTAANREFFRSVLVQRGHAVVAAANGSEALQAFRSQPAERPFDLVLIDVEMPVMDGREMAAAIRALDTFAARPVPLVALTAHQTIGDGQFSADGPFDAALTKPCELAHFYAVIEGLAGDRRAVAEAVRPIAEESEGRVDHRGALRRLGGDEQLFHDLIRFFLDDAPVVLAELGTSLNGNNPPAVERAAHSLKGLVAHFGAKEAMSLAAELQKCGCEGRLGDAPHVYQRLETEVNLLRRELEDLQARARHPK